MKKESYYSNTFSSSLEEIFPLLEDFSYYLKFLKIMTGGYLLISLLLAIFFLLLFSVKAFLFSIILLIFFPTFLFFHYKNEEKAFYTFSRSCLKEKLKRSI